MNKNFVFKSETDTEVIPQLLEDLDDGDFLSTVFKMKAKVKGSYAFGILRQDTNELIGTRKESPLIVGIGKDGFYIASDVIAIEFVKNPMIPFTDAMNKFKIIFITLVFITIFSLFLFFSLLLIISSPLYYFYRLIL